MLYFSPFSERSAAARRVGNFVPNHVNIVSLDLLIHTPLINLVDRELCYFPNRSVATESIVHKGTVSVSIKQLLTKTS